MSTRTNEHLSAYANTLTTNNTIATENFAALQASFSASSGLPADFASVYAATFLGGLTSIESSIAGINDAFVVATGITILGLLFSFFLRRPKKRPNPAE
jgi:hypothetical protein